MSASPAQILAAARAVPPRSKAAPADEAAATRPNVPEWSVTDLAGALKQTLEERFGHVRLRGEVSNYRGPHSSGHAYFSLKDAGARIDAVVWKGAFQRLKVRPEEGLEVIATGRITTFPGKSAYQIVIDTLEPAGLGALMALLEKRRQLFQAEGVFAPERKRPLPYLPRVIGVVTSPTGAVIRDILHRLADRFPRDVVLWPVRVQGEGAADEIAAAIRGLSDLAPDGPVPRPHVVIVARGGGSIEDLWCFNEEAVVRAAAECTIPLIAAVGHETDWTLIDHVADRRAPTPTGAAEMAVPVRADLLATVEDLGRRQGGTVLRLLDRRRSDLRSAGRALPGLDALLAARRQPLDLLGARLAPALGNALHGAQGRLSRTLQGLARNPPAIVLARARTRFAAIDHRPRHALDGRLRLDRERVGQLGQRLARAQRVGLEQAAVRIARDRERVAALGMRLERAGAARSERQRAGFTRAAALFASLNYQAVLARGYALVRDATGRPLTRAEGIAPGDALAIEFADGRIAATRDGGPPRPSPAEPSPKPSPRRAARPAPVKQGSLFDA